MDEKILFIADHLREPGSFSQLCERYGISRKTGYKWVERYQTEGLEGLEERSRRPHVRPERFLMPFAKPSSNYAAKGVNRSARRRSRRCSPGAFPTSLLPRRRPSTTCSSAKACWNQNGAGGGTTFAPPTG